MFAKNRPVLDRVSLGHARSRPINLCRHRTCQLLAPWIRLSCPGPSCRNPAHFQARQTLVHGLGVSDEGYDGANGGAVEGGSPVRLAMHPDLQQGHVGGDTGGLRGPTAASDATSSQGICPHEHHRPTGPLSRTTGSNLRHDGLVHADMLPGLPVALRMHQRQAMPRHPQVHGQQGNRNPCSSVPSPCVEALGIARIPHNNTPRPWDEDMRRSSPNSVQHRRSHSTGMVAGGLVGVAPCRSGLGINVLYSTGQPGYFIAEGRMAWRDAFLHSTETSRQKLPSMSWTLRTA